MAITKPRRVWDPCVIIDYLKGDPRAAPHARRIVDRAIAGEIEIVVSAYAELEVVKLDGPMPEDDERRIKDFFNQDYIVRAQVDPEVAEIAREIVRNYPRYRDLKGVVPKDAVHVATAIRWNVPVFETFDGKLVERIAVDPSLLRKPLVLREPLYDGPLRLTDADGNEI